MTYTSEPSALDALQAIANLPTGKNEDVMAGHEDAYRAIEKLFPAPPVVYAEVDTILEMILADDSPVTAPNQIDAANCYRAINSGKLRAMKRWSLFVGGGDYRMVEQPERGEYVKYKDAAVIINALADELLCMSEAFHSKYEQEGGSIE